MGVRDGLYCALLEVWKSLAKVERQLLNLVVIQIDKLQGREDMGVQCKVSEGRKREEREREEGPT